MISIYALAHPLTGVIRYVGRSRDPVRRLYNHMHEMRARKGNAEKNSWIEAMRRRPSVVILERCRPAVSDKREGAWIARLSRRGRLFNRIDAAPMRAEPRFSITVFPALRDAIVKAAEADGRAKSDWIERALAKVLKVRKVG